MEGEGGNPEREGTQRGRAWEYTRGGGGCRVSNKYLTELCGVS